MLQKTGFVQDLSQNKLVGCFYNNADSICYHIRNSYFIQKQWNVMLNGKYILVMSEPENSNARVTLSDFLSNNIYKTTLSENVKIKCGLPLRLYTDICHYN